MNDNFINFENFKNKKIDELKKFKNIIFRGAPGTGKTYLAKKIAKDICGGDSDRIKFVQFHPNYDYTDFIEGLRPVKNENNISFELKNGIFKDFCEEAKKGAEYYYKEKIKEKEKYLTKIISKKETIKSNKFKKENIEDILTTFVSNDVSLSDIFGIGEFTLEENTLDELKNKIFKNLNFKDKTGKNLFIYGVIDILNKYIGEKYEKTEYCNKIEKIIKENKKLKIDTDRELNTLDISDHPSKLWNESSNFTYYIINESLRAEYYPSLHQILKWSVTFMIVEKLEKFIKELEALEKREIELNNKLKTLQEKLDKLGLKTENEEFPYYVFIIDEINRGDISKILGELFYSIDPDKRGIEGKVTLQYSNLHDEGDKEFYIPENVLIIGTMNDIDRSVESLDIAMRRRFKFIEIKAEDTSKYILEEKIKSLKDENIEQKLKEFEDFLKQINKKIENNGLNSNYHIGASYLKDYINNNEIDKDNFWNYSLKPLIEDYFLDEKEIISDFEKLILNKEEENTNESK